MSTPGRYLARVVLFMLVLCGVFCILYLVTRPLGPDSAYGHSIDKQRLLREAPGRRIILVGGSNMFFGIDSHLLHSLSGLHPVNLALNMGLGVPYMLEEVRTGARAGDIVILSPEYHHFMESQFDSYLCMRAIIANPACVSLSGEILTLRNLAMAVIRFPAVVQRYVLEDLFPDISFRQRGNEYGDIRNEFQIGRDSLFAEMNVMIEFAEGYPGMVIDEFNGFAEWCDQHEVSVFLFYPPYRPTAFQKSEAFITGLHLILEEELAFPLLNEPADECYPDSLFFNTDYHLNTTGSQLRTRRLWELLSGYPILSAAD